MELEEKIKAYIIKTIVDENYYSKEQLSGINSFLNKLTKDTLNQIAEEIVIDFEGE